MKKTYVVWVPLLLFGISGCSSVKKEFESWVNSDGKEKGKEDQASKSIIRPTDAEGLIPSSDQAVPAAQKLHQQLYPGQQSDHVISAIGDDTGTVQIYLVEKGRKTKAISYWVSRGEDRRWYAYQKLPVHENHPFVFKQIAKEYLSTKHTGTVKIKAIDYGDGEREREVRVQYISGDEIFIKALDFKKDIQEGWLVSNHKDVDRVHEKDVPYP